MAHRPLLTEERYNVNQVILTESERKEANTLTEEFKTKGGMTTEELISRLNTIPFEEFMNNISEKIRIYK